MPRPAIAFYLFAALTLCVGCRPADEIRSYSVPKEKSRGGVAKPSSEPATPSDRMLVGVIPHGDQATFVKLVGPIPQVSAIEGEVKMFVESLTVSGDEPPVWELPAGWREDNTKEMRRSTLLIPANGETLEIAITQLPWQRTDDFLLANINRWRGQIGLPPIGREQLKGSFEKIKIGDTEAFWLDLTGKSSGGSMPPFAGGGAPPPLAKPVPPASEPVPPGLPFTQEVPAGWRATPATQFRTIGFAVGEGPTEAVATVTSFSAEKPQMASPLANINRWRGEVGQPPIDESELAKIAQQATISGKAGIFVEMESPADQQPGKATLAAMTQRGDLVWFFKLHGPRETVLGQREPFQAWLDSIQFEKE